MAPLPFEEAKRIVTDGLSFRIPAERGLFPPRDVANAFFGCGYDDRPGEQILEWAPFCLSEEEYAALLAWWRSAHHGARVERLGVDGADFSRWFSRAVRREK